MNNVSVVIPVYNENPAIVTKTYSELVMMGAEVIVVDDGSHMDFPDEVNVITYIGNMGYGYAIKTGIKKATRPYILTMDGDGQHTSSDAQKLSQVFNLIDDCSMVVGTRWNLKESWYRWVGRKVINLVASLWARHYLQDLNSGMRIFRRDLAISYESILCDPFSYTTSLTMRIVTDGYKVAYFPIDVKPRVYGKSKVKLLSDGLVTVWYIFWIGFALNTRRIRTWIRHILGQ